MKKGFGVLTAAALLMAAGNAWTANDISQCAPQCAPGIVKKSAPEIDATAGTQGLALLAGMLMLVAERKRRR